MVERLMVFLALAVASGCASLGIDEIENMSVCDLPAAAICAHERVIERGASRASELADGRVCYQVVTECPDGAGGYAPIDCKRHTCAEDTGAGDFVDQVVTVRDP